MELKKYTDPNITFLANQSDLKIEEYELWIGEEYYLKTEQMSQEELHQFAKERRYLKPNCTYIDVDGNIETEYLRQHLMEVEQQFPENETYPAGRAYDYLIDYAEKMDKK